MLRTVADQPTLVGSDPARGAAPAPGRAGPDRRVVGRSGVLRPVRPVLRPTDGSAVDADGDLSAVDVPQVPLPAGVRVVVPGGVGLDHLAAVLPDRDRPAGAASDHVDEADHPLRVGRGRRVERGPAGEGGRRRRCCARTKIRVDTTVVPANVAYPTDSGLLAKAINRIATTGRRIQAAGGAVRTRLRDRSRAAGQRAHDLNAKLRTRNAAAKDEALAVVRRKNAELAEAGRDRRRRGGTAPGQRETSHPRRPGRRPPT